MKRSGWSATETAEALNISDRNLRRLVTDRVLTHAKGGGFDPIPTCKAFIRHLTRDQDGKTARNELAKVQAARTRLTMQRQLGKLATHEELADLGDEFLTALWGAWTLAAAWFYRGLQGVVDRDTQLRIATEADECGKGEIRRLVDRWGVRLKGATVALTDPERIERLMTRLSNEHDNEADRANDTDEGIKE